MNNPFACANAADARSTILLCNQLAAKMFASANAPFAYANPPLGGTCHASADAKHRLFLRFWIPPGNSQIPRCTDLREQPAARLRHPLVRRENVDPAGLPAPL